MSLSPILITSSGTTTTYLPLSTAYPAQAGCSSLFVNSAVEGVPSLFAFVPGYAGHNSVPACMPSQAKVWWEQDTAADLTTRTELGGYKMVCPEAYKTVAMSVLDQSSTRVGCCPSGYNFVEWASAPYPGQCSSPLPTQVVTYIQTVSSGTWKTTSTSIPEPSSIWGVQINGMLFAKPAATSTSVVTSTAEPSASEVADSTTSHSGLARGAKIGIGIGSVMGFVFLCAMLVVGLLFWKGKRRLATSQSQVVIEPQCSEEDQKSFHDLRTEEIHDDQVKSTTRHVGMG